MSVTDQNMSAMPANGAADEAAMRDWAELLVARARAEGVELTGNGGLLTGLVRQVLQTGLEVEMAEHLGYERHAPEGRGTPNSRNGSSPKRVKTDVGEVDLRVPRDRAGTFEPVTVPKHQRRLEGLSGNVISLYAKGLTTGEIQAHLEEIYDTAVSRETISKITDEIVADMAAWQNRPLDAVYPVLLIDAIIVKVRDAQVANRPVYVAIGVNLAGERDVLGLWLGPTGGEGGQAVGDDADRAPQPRPHRRADRVLRRSAGPAGVDPRRLAPGDGADLRRAHGAQQPPLRLPQALEPDHQSHAGDLHRPHRRSRRSPIRELRPALGRHLPGDDPVLAPVLGRVHPVPRIPPELRRVVYTTNAVESLNARFRRAVRHRGHFPNEQAAMKVLYLVATARRKNRENLAQIAAELNGRPRRVLEWVTPSEAFDRTSAMTA